MGDRSLPMDIPKQPYIGLFGNNASKWRERLMDTLDEVGIAYFDPTHPGWAEINAENGDEK